MNPESLIAITSVVVAGAAFVLSWRADARSQTTARTQLYLQLRTRFLEVYSRLPPGYTQKGWQASTPEEKAAVQAYWHQAFDEWYVTNRLHKKHMKGLWTGFYANAILAGMKYDSLRQILFEMVERNAKFGEYWRDFEQEVKGLWESLPSSVEPRQD